MAVAMIGPKFYAWDRNGKPLAFGKLYTYQARTNTPKPTYQSEDQVVENTNPVILNGEGYANVYLDGSYKMVLKDDKDNEIWSSDPVSSSNPTEWANCFIASYLSPTSFLIGGNQTAEYSKNRKVRIDNAQAEYSFTKVLDSTYSNGNTTVLVTEPFVLTSIQSVCTSIISDESGFNSSDIPDYTDLVYKGDDSGSAVDNMVADFNLNPIARSLGDIAKTGGTSWECIDDTSPITIENFRAFNALCSWDFGIVADATDISTGTDNSASLLEMLTVAKNTGVNVIKFPEGKMRFTQSNVISQIAGLQMIGEGMYSTYLYFDNDTADAVFFDLIGDSVNTAFKGMWLIGNDNTTGVRISDDRNYAGANWKNSFTDVRIDRFKTGLWLWSEDQSDTNEQTHSSETTMLHCKIKNCLTGIRFSNIQSVNTTLISTDIENDASGEDYTMVYDESGADLKVFGGSWIGKGRVYHGVRNPAYSISWAGGNIAFYQTRFELRSGATEPVLAFPATTNSVFMNFMMNDTQMVNSTAGRSLCDFASPVQVALTRASVIGSPLTLHQYPSLGSTAVQGTSGLQSRGSFLIKDSSNILYELETTAAPGFTYNESYSCPVRIENKQGYTNSNHLRDSLGFYYQRTPESNTIGAGPALITEKHFVKHNQNEASDVGTFKLRLPNGTTPTKLTVLKHPLVRGNANVVTWYLVKDEADWVTPGTFDVATDAIQMGTIDLTGKSGYYEVDIDWTGAYLDRDFRVGGSKWTEGRMFVDYNSILTGFLGVKYI